MSSPSGAAQDPAAKTYSVAMVAKEIGLAPATLRTWARRHDVGPSVHISGTHRRYSELDLARLMLMRSLILDGATASEAAELSALHIADGVTLASARAQLRQTRRAKGLELADSEPEALQLSRAGDVVREPEMTAAVSSSITAELSEPSVPNESNVPSVHRLTTATEQSRSALQREAEGDGPTRSRVPQRALRRLHFAEDDPQIIEPTDYPRRCSELVSAALRDDIEKCTELIRVHPSEDVVLWWKMFVRPAIDRLAAQTILAAPGHNPRVLLGYLAHGALVDFVKRSQAPAASGNRMHPSRLKNIALIFSPDEDQLALPAHVLTAALADKNCNAHVVSGFDQEDRVVELVRMIRPTCLVFTTMYGEPRLGLIRTLDAEFSDLPIFVGPGDNAELGDLLTHPNIHRIRSFMALFHEVYGALRSQAFDADYWGDGSGVVSAQ